MPFRGRLVATLLVLALAAPPRAAAAPADGFFAAGDPYGRWLSYGAPQFGLFLAGAGAGSPRLRELGLISTQASLLAGVSVLGLKHAVGARRPDGSNSGRGDSSFPSGHSAGAASLAGSVHGLYGPWRALPLHALAVYTAASRVADDKHRPHEVAAGLGIGYLAGFAAARWGFGRLDGAVAAEPWLVADGGGLLVRWRFGGAPAGTEP